MIDRITLPPYDQYDISTFVIHDNTVYIGHFGGYRDAAGRTLPTIEEQTLQTFRNLENAFGEIGLGLHNLAKVTVILKDIADFNGMHSAWQQVFTANYPVRVTITSVFVDEACRIQIEGIAVRN